MKQCDTIQSLCPAAISRANCGLERGYHLRSCGGCRQTLENEDEKPPVLCHKILQYIQQKLLKEHQVFSGDNCPGTGKVVAIMGIGIVQIILFELFRVLFYPILMVRQSAWL